MESGAVIRPLALQESEEQLRFALEGSNQGIWDWNIKTGEIYFSPSWKRMLGFADDDVIDTIAAWEARIHPEDRAQLAHDLQTHFNSANPVHENCYRLRGKDGTYRWIQGRGKIVSRDADGRPLRMIGTHTDITAKKESEEQYRHLFNITPLPTWIYDFDTLQFLAVNDAAINHYGYSRDEFLNMTIYAIRPENMYQDLTDVLANRELHGKTTYAGWLHKKKNGDVIVVEMNATTVWYNGRKARMLVINDITEKVAAEEALRLSHQRFQYATKATSDAIYDLDLSNNQLAWSEGLTLLFGHRPEQLPQLQHWEANIHPEERKTVAGNLKMTIYNTHHNFWKMEYRFATADGAYRHVIDKGFILRDALYQPVRMIGAMQDITDLKQKQLELAESNKRYEYATLATSDIIWDWDLSSDCVLWSDNYEKVTGWTLPEDKCLPLEICVQRFHESQRDAVFASMNAALANPHQHIWEMELLYVKADGTNAAIYNRAYIQRNEAGIATRMIGALQDVTERKKLEEQLLQKELERQKTISNATIETQERERSEIGKELHDNVNQVLTTTKLYLELAQSNPELKEELMQKSQQNIMYVINEIRQLSRSLMNPSLGDLGLVDSIRDLAENVQATRKLKVIVEASDSLPATLPDNLDLTIYRIIQEALNNAVKHARATAVTVSLREKGDGFELVISDNGIGFNILEARQGAGLRNIQNRVYLANGTLHITSSPGAGCTLTMHFNL